MVSLVYIYSPSLYFDKHQIYALLIFRLVDILECVPGAEINVESSEKNLMLTVIAREASVSRVLVLKLANRDERNVIISKLR